MIVWSSWRHPFRVAALFLRGNNLTLVVRCLMRPFITLGVVAFILLDSSPTLKAQVAPRTTVILDQETFGGESYAALQHLADVVALVVDDLIPGPLSRPKPEPIICFEASEGWGGNPSHPAPITLTGPKLVGEPVATRGGTVRIAAFRIRSVYGRRFVMQLAHELAHVKMGTAIDNALIETFATAVSYEALRRLSFFDYLTPMLQTDIRSLPEAVQTQLAGGDLPGLRKYWQEQMESRWMLMNDRAFQTLGALLLQMGNQPLWKLLSGNRQHG